MKKLSLVDVISDLSEKELESAFIDIKNYLYGKDGVLIQDSVIRKVVDGYNENHNSNINAVSVLQMFLYEMAKRKYEL